MNDETTPRGPDGSEEPTTQLPRATAGQAAVTGYQGPSGPPIVTGSGVLLGVSMGRAPEPHPTVAMPAVVGMPQNEALAAVQAAGFAVEVIQNSSRAVPAATVSHQYPRGNAQATKGSRAGIIVSTGVPMETATQTVLPDVVGKTEQEAVAILTRLGLRPASISDYSAAVPGGVVLAEEPNASDLAPALAPAKKGGKGWLWALLTIAAIVIIAAAVLLFSGGGDVDVPDVSGMKEAAAETALTDAGLVLGTTSKESSADVPEGQVISQDPAAGKSVAEGTKVDLVVSGVGQVEVPDVTGSTAARAQSALEEAGLTSRVVDVYDDNVPEGSVVSQSPKAGTSVDEGAEVSLSVSQGSKPPANVSVPDVSGQTQAQAEQTLEDASLKSTAVDAYSDTVPSGSVVSQAPTSGSSVAPDTEVLIFVSQGPAPPDVVNVAVPNVVGMTEAAAETALDDAGFSVEKLELANAADAGMVFAQFPGAGEQAAEGSSVAILVSTGP